MNNVQNVDDRSFAEKECGICKATHTETMLASLKPAAHHFQLCHNNIDSIAKTLGKIEKTARTVRNLAKHMSSIAEKVHFLLNLVNDPPPKGTGIAHLLGKIPKVGTIIKMALKFAQMIAPTVEDLADLFERFTHKIHSTINFVKKVFATTSKVTRPIATFLTAYHTLLDAAHKCAYDTLTKSYPCGNTAAMDMEKAHKVAIARGATDILNPIAKTGKMCADVLTPVDNVLALIEKAADSLAGLLAPALKVVGKINELVSMVVNASQTFMDEFNNDLVAKCTAEIFSPFTNVFGLVTCPADELMHQAFLLIQEPIINELNKLAEAVVADVIRKGVDAVVPEDFHLEIPNIMAIFPNVIDSYSKLAGCTAASVAYPKYAAVFKTIAYTKLPFTITARGLQAQIMARVGPKVRPRIRATALNSGSPCKDAWDNMGVDVSSCGKLSSGRGVGKVQKIVRGCKEHYKTFPLTCTRCHGFPLKCHTYGRLGCEAGFEYDAGLCYPQCKDGYKGVGPVCWLQNTKVNAMVLPKLPTKVYASLRGATTDMKHQYHDAVLTNSKGEMHMLSPCTGNQKSAFIASLPDGAGYAHAAYTGPTTALWGTYCWSIDREDVAAVRDSYYSEPRKWIHATSKLDWVTGEYQEFWPLFSPISPPGTICVGGCVEESGRWGANYCWTTSAKTGSAWGAPCQHRTLGQSVDGAVQ